MRFLSILFLVITLSSCSTVHNSSITPPKDFDKGNEISAITAFSPTGLNVSLAYSPINHLFIHGAINRIGDKPKNYHHNYQYGIGGYLNFDRFNFETEFGIGKGNFGWNQFLASGAYYTLESANGNYDKLYGSFSATFDNAFGITIRYGQTTSSYSYVESPFETYYPINTPHENIYFGGLLFYKYDTEFGLSFFTTLAVDIYQGKGIRTNYPFQLGLGIKYNLNFSKKD